MARYKNTPGGCCCIDVGVFNWYDESVETPVDDSHFLLDQTFGTSEHCGVNLLGMACGSDDIFKHALLLPLGSLSKDVSSLVRTDATIIAGGEMSCYVHTGNVDHPDYPIGAIRDKNLIDDHNDISEIAWTVGTDATVVGNLLTKDTTGPDDDFYIEQTTTGSVVGDFECRVAFAFKSVTPETDVAFVNVILEASNGTEAEVAYRTSDGNLAIASNPGGTFLTTAQTSAYNTSFPVDKAEPDQLDWKMIHIVGVTPSQGAMKVRIEPHGTTAGQGIKIESVDIKNTGFNALPDVRVMTLTDPDIDNATTGIYYPDDDTDLDANNVKVEWFSFDFTGFTVTDADNGQTELELVQEADFARRKTSDLSFNYTAINPGGLGIALMAVADNIQTIYEFGPKGGGLFTMRLTSIWSGFLPETVGGGGICNLRSYPSSTVNPVSEDHSARTGGGFWRKYPVFGSHYRDEFFQNQFPSGEQGNDFAYPESLFTLVDDPVGATAGYAYVLANAPRFTYCLGMCRSGFPQAVWYTAPEFLQNPPPRNPNWKPSVGTTDNSFQDFTASVTNEFVISLGEPQQETVDIVINANRRHEDLSSKKYTGTTTQLGPGSLTPIFSLSHTQTRALRYDRVGSMRTALPTDPQTELYRQFSQVHYQQAGSNSLPIHNCFGMVLDSVTNGLTTLTLISYTRVYFSTSGSPIYEGFWPRTGDTPLVETIDSFTTEHILVDHTGETIAGPYASTNGGQLERIVSVGVGPDGQKVWVESVGGVFVLHIDSLSLSATVDHTDVDIFATSKDFVFVKGFRLTDSTCHGGDGDDWAISYDLTKQIPIHREDINGDRTDPPFRSSLALKEQGYPMIEPDEYVTGLDISRCGNVGDDPTASDFPSRVPVP